MYTSLHLGQSQRGWEIILLILNSVFFVNARVYHLTIILFLGRRRSSERLKADEARDMIETIEEKYIHTPYLAQANRNTSLPLRQTFIQISEKK